MFDSEKLPRPKEKGAIGSLECDALDQAFESWLIVHVRPSPESLDACGCWRVDTCAYGPASSDRQRCAFALIISTRPMEDIAAVDELTNVLPHCRGQLPKRLEVLFLGFV